MALVLVVEDEEDLRNLVVDILMDAGYDVAEAEHGGVALEKARSEKPDIILLDVMMPVMDGFEVLTKLRDNPATQATPVIMVTAFPPAKGELRAWRLGARHYIRKPFDPEQVELSVRVALREIETSTDAAPARDDGAPDPQTAETNAREPEVPMAKVPIAEVPLDEPPMDEAPMDEAPMDEDPLDDVTMDEVLLDEVTMDEDLIDNVPIRTGYNLLDQKLGGGHPSRVSSFDRRVPRQRARVSFANISAMALFLTAAWWPTSLLRIRWLA